MLCFDKQRVRTRTAQKGKKTKQKQNTRARPREQDQLPGSQICFLHCSAVLGVSCVFVAPPAANKTTLTEDKEEERRCAFGDKAALYWHSFNPVARRTTQRTVSTSRSLRTPKPTMTHDMMNPSEINIYVRKVSLKNNFVRQDFAVVFKNILSKINILINVYTSKICSDTLTRIFLICRNHGWHHISVKMERHLPQKQTNKPETDVQPARRRSPTNRESRQFKPLQYEWIRNYTKYFFMS